MGSFPVSQKPKIISFLTSIKFTLHTPPISRQPSTLAINVWLLSMEEKRVRDNRAVYTRKNKPRLIAAAYIRREHPV